MRDKDRRSERQIEVSKLKLKKGHYNVPKLYFQRDRETERQRGREAERQRERETERQRDRETERHTNRDTDRKKESCIKRPLNCNTCRVFY